ncbi:amidinotransferase [Streptomyces sp. Pv4-95]|uniref:dimethylargininase n=1 Tax=Streptomyces sp. Pv4-95 TaxID=3049543 RepID=UPI003891D70E
MRRTARPRHYVMCRPAHFDVVYSINPWMDPTKPVDTPLAIAQWEQLRTVYVSLGHTVDTIDPVPGLPDMVFAANGATVIGDRALVAKFRNAERAEEAVAHHNWLRDRGFGRLRTAGFVNEGEGDYLVTDDWILAGTGFRSDPRSHTEAQEFFERPVISLRLVDPNYYHLDTALAVLDRNTIAYYPEAFSPGSRAVLQRLFTDAIVADDATAAVFGLNAVSDGHNVVLPHNATDLAGVLQSRGFNPIGVDLSELLKAGGSVKCCTMELHSTPSAD